MLLLPEATSPCTLPRWIFISGTFCAIIVSLELNGNTIVSLLQRAAKLYFNEGAVSFATNKPKILLSYLEISFIKTTQAVLLIGNLCLKDFKRFYHLSAVGFLYHVSILHCITLYNWVSNHICNQNPFGEGFP